MAGVLTELHKRRRARRGTRGKLEKQRKKLSGAKPTFTRWDTGEYKVPD